MKYLIPLFVIGLMLVGCTSDPPSKLSDNLNMESEIELGIRATLVSVRIDEGVRATIEANTPEPAPTSDWIPDWATGGTSQDTGQQNPISTPAPLPNIQSQPSTQNTQIPKATTTSSGIEPTPTPPLPAVIESLPIATPTSVPNGSILDKLLGPRHITKKEIADLPFTSMDEETTDQYGREYYDMEETTDQYGREYYKGLIESWRGRIAKNGIVGEFEVMIFEGTNIDQSVKEPITLLASMARTTIFFVDNVMISCLDGNLFDSTKTEQDLMCKHIVEAID